MAVSIAWYNDKQRTRIWLISVSFVLFQFFLQLSSGVVIGAIMQDMQWSALKAGLLSSAFYYVYTSLQIPVGILFDKKSTRFLLSTNAALCSIGCLIFAESHSFYALFISRLIIGTGSAFAFVGLSHLLREYFPLRQFGFLIGLSETLGFLATMIGMIFMGSLINQIGWRQFIWIAGIIGFCISYLCWRHIPCNHQSKRVNNPFNLFLAVLASRQVWLNGLFVGLSFTVITVFGAMWAVPFIQAKLGCSLKQATCIDSFIFLGAAISCPLFGKLASLFNRRKPLMLMSCWSTAYLILTLLYMPTTNTMLLALMMLFIGICCGAYMLAFSIANELAPAGSLSTCTGFTNTLAMLTAPLFQPIIGYLVDWFSQVGHGNQLIAYQKALLMIPGCLIFASLLVIFLPEKT